MNTGAIVLIGAGALGIYALSQSGQAALGGGGSGAPNPTPQSNDNTGGTGGQDMSWLKGLLEGFTKPSGGSNTGSNTPPPSDTPITKKEATSYGNSLIGQASGDPFIKTSSSDPTRFVSDPNSGGGGVFDRYRQQTITTQTAAQRNIFDTFSAPTKKTSSSSINSFSQLQSIAESVRPSQGISQATSVGTSSGMSTSSNTSKSSTISAPTTKKQGTIVPREKSIAYAKGWI